MNKKLGYRKYPVPPDAELLAKIRELYWYGGADGHFRYIRTSALAGHKDGKGYIEICLERNRYKEHRLVWLWHHNETPPFLLDHVNGQRLDNRIENLRPASDAENVRNRLRNGKYPTGVWKGPKGRYCARIDNGNGKLYLGYYDTPQEAAAAYAGASIVLHGKYAAKLSRQAAEPV